MKLRLYVVRFLMFGIIVGPNAVLAAISSPTLSASTSATTTQIPPAAANTTSTSLFTVSTTTNSTSTTTSVTGTAIAPTTANTNTTTTSTTTTATLTNTTTDGSGAVPDAATTPTPTTDATPIQVENASNFDLPILTTTSQCNDSDKDEMIQHLQTLTAQNATSPQQAVDDLASLSASTSNVSVNTLESVLNITSNIINNLGNKTGMIQQPENVVVSIQNFTDNLELPSNITNVTVSSSTTVIQVNDPSPKTNGRYSNVTYRPSNVTSAVPAVRVTIPGLLLDEALSVTKQPVRVVFIVFNTDALFPSPDKTNLVISAHIRGFNPVRLQKPINLVYADQSRSQGGVRLPSNRLKSNVTRTQCSVYTGHKWAPQQCQLVPSSVPPQCRYYQLANFAMIVSSKVLPSAFEMGIVTYIGCGLSIVTLIITIGIYGWIRELRSRQPTSFLLHICITQLIIYVIFIFGMGNVTKRTDCYVTAAFLQYFLLVNWSWMTANAYNMYQAFVKIIGGLSDSLPRKCLFPCYLLPLILVITHVGVTVLYMDAKNYRADDIFFESAYRSRHVCWLHLASLNFGFLLPVGILLLINIIVGSIVFARITCKRLKIQSSAHKQSTTKNFMIAFSLVVNTGVCWVTGYLTLIADNEVYLSIVSWIFTLLISTQGISLFLLHCVRQRDVRLLWLPFIVKPRANDSRPLIVTGTSSTKV